MAGSLNPLRPCAISRAMAKSKTKGKRTSQSSHLQAFLHELEWSVTKRYVEFLRGRGELLVLGDVDVDVPQIIRRRFICDARRCIEWAGDRPLVDRSCCCRYQVPVTGPDRERVMSHLDAVRPNLPADHRLQNPAANAFEQDENYTFDMVNDNPLGGCQFNCYVDGQMRCAIHKTALEHGESPNAWKPVACSLWPLAINHYDDDGSERLLLTIYCDRTGDLFDQTDDDDFACIVDQDPSYPRLYESERAALEHLFSAKWYKDLDRKARKLLKKEQQRG